MYYSETTQLFYEAGDEMPEDAVLVEEGESPPVPEPAPVVIPFDLAGHKKLLLAAVDDYIAAVYSTFTRFDMEYVKREEAARAFIGGGYVGEPSIWVSAFSDNAHVPPAMAAQIIIGQANQLRTALEQLGALRMTKYSISAAGSKEEAESIKAGIFADIAAIASTL